MHVTCLERRNRVGFARLWGCRSERAPVNARHSRTPAWIEPLAEDNCLVADIGGTNTRVAVTRVNELDHGSVRRFLNADFPALSDVLSTFLDQARPRSAITAACIAVAGPVRNGEGALTNRSWRFNAENLAREIGADTVFVLNDLQAQGYALGHLPEGAVTPIIARKKPPTSGQTQLVVGIGTGFNAAPVLETAHGRVVSASESGHICLPIRTEIDQALFWHIENTNGFASVEDILSGRGLAALYAWDGLRGPARASTAAEVIAGLSDPVDQRAVAAMEIFVRLTGATIGDLALIQLPFGGIYLSGGVARAIAPLLMKFGFAEAFCDKGRFADFMNGFHVSLIQDDFAALTGCAAYLANPGKV